MTIVILGLIVGCSKSGGNEPDPTPKPSQQGSTTDDKGERNGSDISGEITFIHHRTDMNDNVFRDEYIPRFNEKYPNVTVKLETMSDYEGQIRIRMNTEDYGDVLMIPGDIPAPDLGVFFEPLGSEEEMSKTYLFLNERAYDGTVYGIPINVNANGIVYNKKVFEAAGITAIPSTTDEFLEAMHKIKENTDAIPYYTNYAAGWALDQWEAHRLSVAGDPEYVNFTMVNEGDPFLPGKPHYIVYKLMYDLANQGLIEEDPLTTDWESSKPMMADGKIGAMVLGSWAISQIQAFADNPDDIGYMPFPHEVDGKVYASSGGDYKIAINVHSKNKEAARAWLDWFIHESGYAQSQGSISPIIGDPTPSTLDAFNELGVIYISDTPNPEQEGYTDLIDQEGEIGLWNPDFKQRIIEAAIGNRSESYDDIMNDLNTRWNQARERIVQQ